MDLILKVLESLNEQFREGVKIRPDRLKDVESIYVVKNDEIIGVYELNAKSIVYNALKNRIELNSILGDEIENHELLHKKINYKTFNPATIKDIEKLLV